MAYTFGQELRWSDHAPVVLKLQLTPQAAVQLRSAAADPALLASVQRQQQFQQQRVAPVEPPGGACDQQHSNSCLRPALGSTAAEGQGNSAAAAGAGVGLPCPLSTYWLLHPEQAAATAADMFAAAGLGRPSAQVLSCSVLHLLQHSKHSAATAVIRQRAQQLHPSLLGELAQKQAPAAAAEPPSGLQLEVPADQAASSQNRGLAAQTDAAVELARAALPATPSHRVRTAAAHSAHTSGRQSQQQQRRGAPAARSSKHSAKQPRPAAGTKRRYRSLDMGDGFVASFACSSSEDSD